MALEKIGEEVEATRLEIGRSVNSRGRGDKKVDRVGRATDS